VKKNNLKKGIFTALLLASPLVTAGTQYPASDFQPKVVYQDANYQHQSSGSTSTASFGDKAKADSNYPAATFQPEVLFVDKEYKHNTKVANKSYTATSSASEPVSENSSVAQETEESSDEGLNPLFGLVILAAAAFLYRKKSSGASKASIANNPEGLTGVAKYLANKTPKLSGVAKYLEANQPAPKSGVAKYVAKKVVENKKSAAGKATGVEKYMRNQNRG